MLSFVIPAYNEEQLLGTTIASLHESGREIGNYEIVVADDASTDDTALVAERNGAASAARKC